MIKAALIVFVLAATATTVACGGTDNPSTGDAGFDTKYDVASYDIYTDTGSPGTDSGTPRTDTSADDSSAPPEDTLSPPDGTSDTGILDDTGILSDTGIVADTGILSDTGIGDTGIVGQDCVQDDDCTLVAGQACCPNSAGKYMCMDPTSSGECP